MLEFRLRNYADLLITWNALYHVAPLRLLEHSRIDKRKARFLESSYRNP